MTNDDSNGYSPASSAGQIGPQPGYPPPPQPYGPGPVWPQPGYGPPPQYSASPVQPRKRRWPWIVGAVVAVAIIVLAIGGYALTRGGSKDKAQTVSVTYEITGSAGPVEIRYHDSAGHLSEPQTVTPPWQTRVLVPQGRKQLVSVSGQRPDSSDEPLACRITSEGKSIDRKQSAGGFVFCGGYLRGD